ncbi:MAG: hypothetical protein L6Q95_18000 [Planctomycetes bacterium]|nr:hypothetical protein [Planctomycetota bacterium]
MRNAAFLAGLAVTVLGSANAGDEAIWLEPKWNAGDRVRVTLVTSQLANCKEVPEPRVVQTRRVEYEESVTEAKSGVAMRTVRHFKRFDVDVVTEDKPKRHAFHGKKVEFHRVDGVLQCRKEADLRKWREDLTDLLKSPMPVGADWAWLLPTKLVSVGDRWKLETGGHLATVHRALTSGEATCELASIKDGIALLRFTKPDETWSGQASSFRGEAEFSLELGRVVRGSMESVSTWVDRREGKVVVVQRITCSLEPVRDDKGTGAAKSAPAVLQPKWKAGERVSVRLVTTTHSTASGKTELLETRTVEYEEKVAEEKGGLPTRVQRTFRKFEAQRSFEDAPRKHALAGKTVEFRSADGVLQCGEDLSDLVLDPMSAGADWGWLLPGKKAVAVGESWKAPSGMSLSTVHWALVRPGTTCELLGVKDGIALLRFRNDRGLAGEAQFSLESGRVLFASLEGAGEGALQKVTFEAEILKD